MLNCAFCQVELPGMDRPVSLLGRLETCENCGINYTVAENEAQAREAIAAALGLKPTQIEMASAAVSSRRPLFLYCGWDPNEPLTVLQATKILRRKKASIQEQLRLNRIPGAYQDTLKGKLVGWLIPRAALQAYQRAGRKPYTMRKGVRRGRPPKRKVER